MEGSNYWGYGYKTQHPYPRSWLITWRRPEVKFGRNVVNKKQHKNYQDEDKKSVINKKLILKYESIHLVLKSGFFFRHLGLGWILLFELRLVKYMSYLLGAWLASQQVLLGCASMQ